MESASVVCSACVNAASGTPVGLTEDTDVFGVVPEVIPALADEPLDEAGAVITFDGAVRTPELGVYRTEVVSAFDPADADADDENDVAAPAPLAPADPFAWM